LSLIERELGRNKRGRDRREKREPCRRRESFRRHQAAADFSNGPRRRTLRRWPHGLATQSPPQQGPAQTPGLFACRQEPATDVLPDSRRRLGLRACLHHHLTLGGDVAYGGLVWSSGRLRSKFSNRQCAFFLWREFSYRKPFGSKFGRRKFLGHYSALKTYPPLTVTLVPSFNVSGPSGVFGGALAIAPFGAPAIAA